MPWFGSEFQTPAETFGMSCGLAAGQARHVKEVESNELDRYPLAVELPRTALLLDSEFLAKHLFQHCIIFITLLARSLWCA